jgi:hypothetical protein
MEKHTSPPLAEMIADCISISAYQSIGRQEIRISEYQEEIYSPDNQIC